MADIDNGFDEQDQSETFDETHLDDEGDGDMLLDEVDDVLDVTQAAGDGDDEMDEDDLDIDDQLSLEGVEPEADALLGMDAPRLSEIDSESDDRHASDEVELVYVGLMRNEKGAQGSAAHWEARRLSDDDLEDLGYGPDAEATQETQG